MSILSGKSWQLEAGQLLQTTTTMTLTRKKRNTKVVRITAFIAKNGGKSPL
jgi:hypothetical protein